MNNIYNKDVDKLAKYIADQIGHGMREKCYEHAKYALEFLKERSCTNCKFEKWSNEKDGSICKIHEHELNDMFNDDLPLDKIGCLQFQPKI